MKGLFSRIGIAATGMILAFGTQGLVQAGEPWSLFDLGTLGGDWSRPYDINENGHIVGSSQLDPQSNKYHGWFLTLDTGMVDIDPAVTKKSKSRGINNSEIIVGWFNVPDQGPHAYRKLPGGELMDLGTFGGLTSKARSINEDGWIAGFADDANGHPIAFRWDPTSQQKVSLGTLASGNESEARSINNFGDVTGLSNITPDGTDNRAFFWDHTTGSMVDLGTLGGASSIAYGLNDSGMVIGDSNDTSGKRKAFVWDNGVMQKLTTLSGADTLGGLESLARGVNNLGQVVGRSNVSDGSMHGFLWDSVNGMIDVNDLLPMNSLWVVTEIRSINDNGYMVGTAEFDGGPSHAVLMAPALSMDTPDPGLAGEANWFRAHGAVPQATVYLLASNQQGQTPVPFCGSLMIDLAQPITLIATRSASNEGNAKAKRKVGARFGGKTIYLQAIERTGLFDCRASALVAYQFPQ